MLLPLLDMTGSLGVFDPFAAKKTSKPSLLPSSSNFSESSLSMY
ncbi:MAG: hypothetical protein ACO2OR_02770 [Desulfurococcaceae archaeon]